MILFAFVFSGFNFLGAYVLFNMLLNIVYDEDFSERVNNFNFDKETRKYMPQLS